MTQPTDTDSAQTTTDPALCVGYGSPGSSIYTHLRSDYEMLRDLRATWRVMLHMASAYVVPVDLQRAIWDEMAERDAIIVSTLLAHPAAPAARLWVGVIDADTDIAEHWDAVAEEVVE